MRCVSAKCCGGTSSSKKNCSHLSYVPSKKSEKNHKVCLISLDIIYLYVGNWKLGKQLDILSIRMRTAERCLFYTNNSIIISYSMLGHQLIGLRNGRIGLTRYGEDSSTKVRVCGKKVVSCGD